MEVPARWSVGQVPPMQVRGQHVDVIFPPAGKSTSAHHIHVDVKVRAGAKMPAGGQIRPNWPAWRSRRHPPTPYAGSLPCRTLQQAPSTLP
jgi:hypothetical protein